MLASRGRRAADSRGAPLLRAHQRNSRFLSCLPALVAVAGIAPWVRSGQAIDLNPLPWDGPLAFVLHVDALSVLFAFMGACIGGLVLLYSIGYMAHDKSATRFYAIMLVFIGGFIALVYSANLFIFYLCWELVGLCSFTLVGFWYTNREAVNGARKVLLMTHIAGYGCSPEFSSSITALAPRCGPIPPSRTALPAASSR
jgi:NADH:ubiquinone oxidoreductase subunit 5 (subunit L)/multisubunit Na+/H+ antiporter MnhA subunit